MNKGSPISNVSQRVRQNYQTRPYPPVAKSARRLPPVWRIPAPEWIAAMAQQRFCEPRRILVAGCGTGNEAFAFRERFKNSEIVALDFSSRSIAIARELQRRQSRAAKISFRCADLTSHRLSKTAPGTFDFISCHGVLSYIPNAAAALQNLRAHLAPEGALHLGVNGLRHCSQNWRPALREFGFDPQTFRDDRELRDTLELFDALADHGAGELAHLPAEYLAGDLFGAVIANRPLEEWIATARDAGLHFRGSYAAHRTLRRVLNDELYHRLLPRPRAQAHMIAEQIAPSAFHHLVFTAKPAPLLPWDDSEGLLDCAISRTSIYKPRLSQRRAKPVRLRPVSLASAATNTSVDLEVPAWVADLLAKTHGTKAVGQILGARARRISPRSLRKHLYLLDLLAAINLTPPATR